MKNSDKKTEMQPEEAKPVEEIKSQPAAKPEKTTKPAAKPAKATPAASAKSKTAAKPKETTKKATKPAAPVEEVKAEATEQPVEEVKPAEEPKAEQPVSEQQPVEEVKAEVAATAPEKPAEEKSDKKSFFSSKRNIAIVACAGAAVFALSLGLGLGLGLKKNGDEDEEEPVKTAFSVPAGVTVTESTLSWTAVDNATNGYTIKFAESEKEKSVTSVSYNLLGDTTYLVEGTNTLSVKVNATDTYNASAYSATVTYTYVLPVVEEKFDAPVGLKVEEKVLKWTAVAGATSYTVKLNDDETTTVNTNSLDLTTVTAKLNEGENVISVRVNAVGDKKASDYSATVKYTYVDEDKTAATAFASLIDALDITATDAEAKLTAAKAAYAELSARAKELAAASYAKLKDADGKYFVSLVEKIGTVTEDSGDSIAAAVTYYATVIDTTAENVVTAKATLDEKNSQYQHFYESYVAAFGELVNAIVIENTSRGEVIDTALTAVGAAENYYNAQTAKVKAALAELKVTLDSKKTAYAAAVKAEMDGYMALVDEALDLIEAASDLTALTAKKTEITAYELSDVNKTAVEADDELTANIASIDTAIESWNTAISDAVAALTVTASGDDEADIVSATEALAEFENYAAYIKANASVIAAKTATKEVLATAKGNIETTVNDIKRAAEAAIANTEPNETNYAALEEQKTAIEAVDGAYATQYLETLKIGDDGVKEAVEKAMETMLATAVDTAGGEAYSLTGTTLKITLFRTFYNFRNEKIAATDSANAPKLTVDGNTVTVEQDFTKNELNEYVAIINIENLGVIGDDATYTVTVGSDENAFALKFGETIGENPYFTDTDEEVDGTPTGFKKAIDGDNFVMNFQGGCTAENYYLEVYNAEAITIDGEFVKFSEMPLGRIDVTDKQTMPIEDFNRLIANSLSDIFIDKTVTVRFMIYGTTVTDEVPAFTAMNASVISEAIEFNLVEADKYYKLSFKTEVNNLIGDTGASNLIVPMQMYLLSDFINETLTANNISDVVTLVPNVNNQDQADPNGNLDKYIGIKLEVKASDGEILYIEHLPLKLGAFNFNEIIKNWSAEYYKAHRNDNDHKTFDDIEMYISYEILDNGDRTSEILQTYFPRSESKRLIGANEDLIAKYSSAELTKQKLEMNVGQIDGLASGTEKTGDWAYGRWELSAPNGTDKYEYYDGLTVLIYEVPEELTDGVTVQDYDFFGEAIPFAIYFTDSFGNMNWSEVNGAITKAWFEKAKKGEIVNFGSKSFVFLFQHKINDAGYDAGYFDSDVAYVTTENAGAGERTVISYERDFRTPDGAQLKFQDSSYILLLRENQPTNTNGSIFDEQYGVQYIEVEFTFNGTTKSAYLFVETANDGARIVKMYTNTDKSYDETDANMAPFSCSPVYDSSIYIGGDGFKNWIKYNYGIENFDALQTSFRTRIWHNGTAYIGTPASDDEDALQYGNWSDSVEYDG